MSAITGDTDPGGAPETTERPRESRCHHEQNLPQAPWTTDDGVLWVKVDQTITLGTEHISLALDGPDGPTRTLISPAEALVLSTRFSLDMQIPGSDLTYRVVRSDDLEASQ
jgi:hypothetical protein